MARITNAAEARKKRGGTTLVERTMRDPVRAARIERRTKAADIEQMVQTIMASRQVTAAELARRINAKPPQISRDLHGGLRRATLGRLAIIAEALGYEFVPVLVPRDDSAQRRRFFEVYQALQSFSDAPQRNRRTEPAVPAKRSAQGRKRSAA
jgi:transcriptional regulator with XRE-family HTH domain